MTRKNILIVVFGCLSSIACGNGADGGADAAWQTNCSMDPRAQTYAAGMVGNAEGQSSLKVKLASADPAPPARFDNDWTIQVLDAADNPVDGVTVTVLPFMPDHGHGTSPVVVSAGTEPMTHDLSAISFWMPGLWQVHVHLNDGDTHEVIFSFCILE